MANIVAFLSNIVVLGVDPKVYHVVTGACRSNLFLKDIEPFEAGFFDQLGWQVGG
jgi:hypothetical protein